MQVCDRPRTSQQSEGGGGGGWMALHSQWWPFQLFGQKYKRAKVLLDNVRWGT